jgi:hypothetical protein
MISLLSFISSLWTTSRANGSLPANGGAHTCLGLHHLHTQEMGDRTPQEWARPADPGSSRPGSVAPSLPWVLLTSCTLPPSIASFWQCHPHVQDRGSSHMKSGLLGFNPRWCSFVTLRSLPPLGVISSCTWIRTGLLICSFELVVTLSFLPMFSYKNITIPNAHMKMNLLYH